jgi:cysteine desulfurase
MKFTKKPKKNIHLDYASTTPICKKVLKKMDKFFSFDFHNPSSIYLSSKKVKETINDYRTKIAKSLQVKSDEIIFVNGGTESVNIAIQGVMKKIGNRKRQIDKGHIISTTIEHPAVLDPLEEAKRNGFEVTLLDVNEEGLVSVEDVKNALREDTVLVTICYATNEFGTVEPIAKIAREILKYKEKLGRGREDLPHFHTDASQAGLTLDLNMDRLKVDMMSLDGSKIYGPKATGCLVKKSYVEIAPILFGGGQEYGIRPGTENVSGIVGFSEALLQTFDEKEKDKKHFQKLQDYMLEKLEKEIPEAVLNGPNPSTSPRASRLLNNVNVCIEGLNSEFAVIMLDELGINCSPMTACKALRGAGQSYAIEALGKPECAGSSIRFSFGRETTKGDINKAIKALREVVDFQMNKS